MFVKPVVSGIPHDLRNPNMATTWIDDPHLQPPIVPGFFHCTVGSITPSTRGRRVVTEHRSREWRLMSKQLSKESKKCQKRCLFLAETCWNKEKELRDDRKSFEKTFRVVTTTISKVGNSCNQGETGSKRLSKWAHFTSSWMNKPVVKSNLHI